MSIFRRNILKINGGGKINPNLLTGTRDFSEFSNPHVYWGKGTYEGCKVLHINKTHAPLYKEINIKANMWYTFSVTIRAAVGTNLSIRIVLSYSSNDVEPAIVNFQNIGSDFYRKSITFRASKDIIIAPNVVITTAFGWLDVCQYKLEEGKKATPWCPNIND